MVGIGVSSPTMPPDPTCLDEPWRNHLPQVNSRVERALERAGMKTLREAIVAYQSGELLTRGDFGWFSQRELRVALEPYLPLLPPRPPEPDPVASPEDLAVLDEPWECLLTDLPLRVRTALQRTELRTLGDVVQMAQGIGLLRVTNFGRGSLRALRGATERYASLLNARGSSIDAG